MMDWFRERKETSAYKLYVARYTSNILTGNSITRERLQSCVFLFHFTPLGCTYSNFLKLLHLFLTLFKGFQEEHFEKYNHFSILSTARYIHSSNHFSIHTLEHSLCAFYLSAHWDNTHTLLKSDHNLKPYHRSFTLVCIRHSPWANSIRKCWLHAIQCHRKTRSSMQAPCL